MTERSLSAAPSMVTLFARAAASAVPGASRLPFVGGGGGQVPDLTLNRDGALTDRERLAAYDRVCGFDLSNVLPPTYPHILAFPLHLALLTDGDFPFAAIGLVHISNRIVQHRPIQAGERLDLRVWATPLEPHPRGRRFSLRTEVRVGGELVWEEVSTNLHRGHGDPEAPAPEAPPSSEALPASATWRLRGDLGRRYGAVSGDLNPIHIHPLSARLFGFHSAIAHGMWTKARSLAALGPQLPGAFTVEVAFRRPLLLPATVTFGEAREPGEIRFGVRDAERGGSHLDGLLTL
jgi:acyl dehydratase